MNRRRAELGITWDEVAQRGGISVAWLRKIRKGQADITTDMKYAIQRGLAWPDGQVDGALAGSPTGFDPIQHSLELLPKVREMGGNHALIPTLRMLADRIEREEFGSERKPTGDGE
jgi:transcriptional regulator with XRE-family HTH domain